MTPTDRLAWGIVAHLVADWPLQNDWLANNKARRRERMGWLWRDQGMRLWGPLPTRWWDRHPAAYVHAGIHGLLLTPIFGRRTAALLALTHLVIDCRWPVAEWSRLVRQTQPGGWTVLATRLEAEPTEARDGVHAHREQPLYDVGVEVRFWTDQTFHIATIAAAALALGDG